MTTPAPQIDGIFNLNKPTGITSAKAVYRIRSITGVRKSGHAGTLDPGADGVLLVCQGKATKLVEQIMDLPKVYRTTARLDVTSESYDSDRQLIDVPVREIPTEQAIRDALATFEGETEQYPPRVSAIKLGGVPAYKTVGMENAPKIRPKTIRIYWIVLNSFAWPEVDFTVACGRGTYIRGLIRDIGVKLDTGGCLTSLTRLAVGPFNTDDAETFDSLADAPDPNRLHIPLEKARELISQPVTIPPRPADMTSPRS